MHKLVRGKNVKWPTYRILKIAYIKITKDEWFDFLFLNSLFYLFYYLFGLLKYSFEWCRDRICELKNG